MPTATTTTTTMVYPSYSTTLKSSSKSVSLNGSASASSTATTLRSLYSRAARAFLHRDIIQTHSLIESAFLLLKPLVVHDTLAEHRKKWDILRVTLETTVYADPPSMNSIPPQLKLTLADSPHTLMSKIYARSLGLFTPSVGPSQPSPSAAYLPSAVLITLLYSSLKIGCADVGRVMAEQWLSKRESPLVLTPSDDSAEEGYEKVIEIYTLHILPKLEQWQYAKEFLQFEGDLPEHTREFMRSRLNALHAESLASQRPVSRSPSATPTPRSHSPAPSQSSSSSLSTTSTHTVVPVAKSTTASIQPLASPAAVSVSSKASSEGTATPTPRGRTAELPNGQSRREASEASSSAASAPRTNVQVTPLQQPTVLSLIKASLAPHLTTSKLATFLILFVLFPIVSWVLRIRHRRRKAVTAPSNVDLVRRRLQGASASEAGFARRLWDSSLQAVLDTVKMAGSGLV